MSVKQTVESEVKKAVEKFKSVLNNQKWIDQARTYADQRRDTLKKTLDSDVEKIRQFILNEKKELESIQKQIPTELKKIRTFVKAQQKEFTRLLKSVETPRAVTSGKRIVKTSAKTKKTAKRTVRAKSARSSETNTRTQE